MDNTDFLFFLWFSEYFIFPPPLWLDFPGEVKTNSTLRGSYYFFKLILEDFDTQVLVFYIFYFSFSEENVFWWLSRILFTTLVYFTLLITQTSRVTFLRKSVNDIYLQIW